MTNNMKMTRAQIRLPVPLIAFVASFVMTTSYASAQGSVTFANNLSTAVSNCLTLARVTADGSLRVGLYYGPVGTPESSLQLLPASISFASPGVFNGGTRTVPFPAGQPAVLQVRVWQAAYGSTYEQAANAGVIDGRESLLGKSAILLVVIATAASPGSLPFLPLRLLAGTFPLAPGGVLLFQDREEPAQFILDLGGVGDGADHFFVHELLVALAPAVDGHGHGIRGHVYARSGLIVVA